MVNKKSTKKIQKIKKASKSAETGDKMQICRPPSRKALSPKEKIFCLEYIANGFNGRKAAHAAGYHPEIDITANRSIRTKVDVAAGDLLKNPAVIETLNSMMEDYLANAQLRSGQVAEGLVAIASTDMRDIVQWGPKGARIRADSQISPIHHKAVKKIKCTYRTVKEDEKGKPLVQDCRLEVELHDKLKALEIMAKCLGMYTDTSVQNNIMMIQGDASDEAYRRRFMGQNEAKMRENTRPGVENRAETASASQTGPGAGRNGG